MKNIQELSDSELQALYAGPAMIQQESGGRPGVVGPQTRYGRAEGMTQMLPATAKATAARIGEQWRPELMRGNTPEAAAYQERLGLAYLQEGIEKTGSLEGAFKYYHGGPDRRLWRSKTNRYAQEVSARLTGGTAPQQSPDLTSLSDDELMAMYQQPAPQGRQQPAVSVTIDGVPGRGEYMAPKPAPRMAGPPANAPRMQAKGLGLGDQLKADFMSGVQAPWEALKRDASNYYKSGGANGDPLGGLAAQGRLLGGVLGLTSAPIQGVARAAAGQLSKLPTYDNSIARNPLSAPRRLSQPEAKAALEGDIMTASAAATARAPNPKPRMQPQSLEGLETAKRAAYRRADQLGVRYDSKAFADMVDSVEAEAVSLGLDPDLHKGAASALKNMRKRVDAGQAPTLTELDNLRKIVTRDATSGPDAAFGKVMRDTIDAFIDSADGAKLASGGGPEGAAAIRDARRLNTQWVKAKKVTEALDNADLQAASTYAGGNKDNARRQNLRPLVKKTSNQRITNFTPDEAKAARRAVTGTAGQNVARVVGKLTDPRSLLGSIIQIGLSGATGGMSAASIPVGVAASEASNLMGARAAKKLVDLITSGGVAPRRPPVPPLTSRMAPVPLLSPKGLIGAGVTSQPLRDLPIVRAPRKKSKRAR